MLLQFIPTMIIQIAYAILVYLIAGKRGVSRWPWTIGALVPVIGLLVGGVFLALSFLSVFDRLNRLEEAR